MFSKLKRSRIAGLALGLLAFVAVGYFSNAITSTACERATSQWLNDKSSQSQADWPERRSSSMPAEYRFPWIIAVHYEWVAGPHGGEWGARYYLTLFGIPFPIRNHIYLQS